MTSTEPHLTVDHQPRRAQTEQDWIWLGCMDSIAERDAFLCQEIDNPDRVDDLLSAARSTPDGDPRTPDLCAALAVLSYRHHRPELTWAALQRVWRLNPAHRLAALLATAIAADLPPEDLSVLTAYA